MTPTRTLRRGIGMRLRISMIFAIALLCVGSTASWAQLTPYSQDFEGFPVADGTDIIGDGWTIFANVFTPGGAYIGGYGPFDAPNGGFGGPAFSAIVAGEGGPDQGMQQLSVFSDYNNVIEQSAGNFIEANVFQEQVIGAADINSTWVFEFDYKRGNIEGQTTALAFIKTFNPDFSLSNFVTADMTDVPADWGNTFLSLYIDANLEGQILQFGFLSLTTNFEGSGIFYDNVNFSNVEDICPDDGDTMPDEESDDEAGDDSIYLLDTQFNAPSDGLLELGFGRPGNDTTLTTNDERGGARDATKRRAR